MGPLRQVVLKCIDRDPDQRYQSASDLIEALRNAKNPEPAVAKKSRRDWLWASGAALATGGLAAVRFWPDAHAPVASGPIDSLAVMPFSGGGNNTDIDYLREGIAESLTNKLAAMANLRVMSRDSTFRQRDLPAVDAGRKLAVRGVITGTIHKIADALIVSAELVDSANGSRLWGDEFRGAATDVLMFRDKIAASIAGKLQMQLKGSAEKPEPATRETANNEAHDLYMKGRFHSGKVDLAEIRKGIKHFEKAIELDPGYALAHAARAEAHIFIADLFVPGKEVFPAARESARKAVEADPQLAEGHVALALVAQLADLDWGACEAGLRKAIVLNPHLAAAYSWLGWVLSATGHREEGLAASRQAVSKEPHSPLAHALLSANLYFAHDDEGAFHEAGVALEIDPHFHLAQMWRGLSMIQRGFPGVVSTKLEQAKRKSSSPVIIGALGRAYAAAGKTDKARAMLDELKQAQQTQHVSAILFAELTAALKDNEAALGWLEKAYETRSKLLIWTKLDPAYDALRKEPRFQTLLSQMHL